MFSSAEAAFGGFHGLVNKSYRKDVELFDERALAIAMHDKLCLLDNCGWEYESYGEHHTWTGTSHSYWLKHVRSMVKQTGLSIQDIMKVILAL